MAPLVGRDITERYFLPRFELLCSDPLFHVRKVSNMLGLKALVNEDTLLRTHCCPWCFLGCANWETFIADTKCFWTKSETFFVSRTDKICVHNKFCVRGQTEKHLCGQQCVRNNVSSFARALIVTYRNMHTNYKKENVSSFRSFGKHST